MNTIGTYKRMAEESESWALWLVGENYPFSAPPLPDPEHLKMDGSRKGWQTFLSLVIL